MSIDVTTTRLYHWYEEVWNKGNAAAIDELLAPEVIAYGLGPGEYMQGTAAFKESYAGFGSMFSDVHVHIDAVMVNGDMETALCHVTASSVPGKKPLAFKGLCMAKFENGQIVKAWNYFDFLKMYEQLGYQMTVA